MKKYLAWMGSAGLVLVLVGNSGCGRNEQKPAQAAVQQGGAPTAEVQLCNFIGGPDDAKVTVTAFYPGRHEDTLAAVKSLLQEFDGKVHVEIVDWRTKEGMQRRDASGLTCAGVIINGKNTFDIVQDGKTSKVLFVRGIDGEWTKDDLYAAVKQELAVGER